MRTTTTYLLLMTAILTEVAATTALKASESFTRPIPSVMTVVGYALSFYCLSLSLRTLPTGIAYAIWSGVGIVLISTVSWLYHRQSLDLPAMAGMGLIISGVLVINVFSKSSGH